MCWRNRTMTHLLSSFHSVVTSMSPVCLPSGEGELPSRLHAGRRDHQDEIHWTPDRPLPPDMSPPPPSPWSWRRWSAGPSKVVHWTQTFTLSINTKGTVLTHSAAIPVCVVMNSLFLKLWWYNPLNPARDIVVLSDHWYPKKRCVWFSELHLFFLGGGIIWSKSISLQLRDANPQRNDWFLKCREKPINVNRLEKALLTRKPVGTFLRLLRCRRTKEHRSSGGDLWHHDLYQRIMPDHMLTTAADNGPECHLHPMKISLTCFDPCSLLFLSW